MKIEFGGTRMAPASLTRSVTAEDLLALSENGMERWIVNGELRKTPLTIRNRFHSELMARISSILTEWVDSQNKPRGAVLCGQAGVRLRNEPETTYGIDVVYICPEVACRQSEETTIVDGVPTLVGEILCPSDTQEEIDEKTDEYLKANVPLVWNLDPHDCSITAYQPNAKPQFFTRGDEIAAEPWLPGFRVSVDRIFGGRFQKRRI